MDKIWFPIVFTTLLMVFVNIIPFPGAAPEFMAFILLLSPALVWMVLKTLKDGIPSEKTFETHLYEDRNV